MRRLIRVTCLLTRVSQIAFGQIALTTEEPGMVKYPLPFYNRVRHSDAVKVHVNLYSVTITISTWRGGMALKGKRATSLFSIQFQLQMA